MWFSRNQALHKGVFPKASKLVANINRVSLEHLATWTSKSSPISELWSPPPLDSFKVNFDTAIRDDFSTQATICRNYSGKIIKILSQVRPPCSPAYGETQAALLAYSLAVSLNLENFVIEDLLLLLFHYKTPLLLWTGNLIMLFVIFFLLFQPLPLGKEG
jgi:hypothetical protein